MKEAIQVKGSFIYIIFICCSSFLLQTKANARPVDIDFYGENVIIEVDTSIKILFNEQLSVQSVKEFHHKLLATKYTPTIQDLLKVQCEKGMNDWIFYQLIRKTAESICPKASNYNLYTLYKWFLLKECGYDATLSVSDKHILFYVKSDDNIYGIPFYLKSDKQYVCLNVHDYSKINFDVEIMEEVIIEFPTATKTFSYKIDQLPEFKKDDYQDRKLSFTYKNKKQDFNIKLNPLIQQIFKNYPVVDFETYFNIPISQETYSTLIPALKKNVNLMSQEQGVAYIMNFTRHAFLFETDQINFGQEKRMSAEQTLLHKYSDCDDRASLFFYLVKEIYNLPMIAVLYPTHISMAVKLDKPIGTTIEYLGEKYSFCDPTPQLEEAGLGEVGSKYKDLKYEIVYSYHPTK